MEMLLHGQSKLSINSILEGEILTFGTCIEVLEYFENGSIKEYKNGNIKIQNINININMEITLRFSTSQNL